MVVVESYTQKARSFLTREEKVELLKEYRNDLEKEAQGVSERIKRARNKLVFLFFFLLFFNIYNSIYPIFLKKLSCRIKYKKNIAGLF